VIAEMRLCALCCSAVLMERSDDFCSDSCSEEAHANDYLESGDFWRE